MTGCAGGIRWTRAAVSIASTWQQAVVDDLRDDFFDDAAGFDTGQPLIESLKREAQPLVIDAQ